LGLAGDFLATFRLALVPALDPVFFFALVFGTGFRLFALVINLTINPDCHGSTPNETLP
jgi:hypothetical protein